jgi:hypothetical protein
MKYLKNFLKNMKFMEDYKVVKVKLRICSCKQLMSLCEVFFGNYWADLTDT